MSDQETLTTRPVGLSTKTSGRTHQNYLATKPEIQALKQPITRNNIAANTWTVGFGSHQGGVDWD